MTIQEEVCEALAKKCAELFNKKAEDLGPDTNLVEDLGAKSTNYVQISAMLEDMYDLEVPYMELKRKLTFAEIGDYINSLFD
ncbi:acyl carrier protein [Eubacterium ramulus]